MSASTPNKKRTRDSSSSPGSPSGPVSVSVAHTGDEHTFHWLAARRYFEIARPAAVVSLDRKARFVDIFEAVKSGHSTYGIAPLESSSSGTVHQVYDLLLRYSDQVTIVGEMSDLDRIAVFGKTQIHESSFALVLGRRDVLVNCSDYLDAIDARRSSENLKPLDRVASVNPAMDVAQGNNEHAVALSPAEAGEFHGLAQIKPNVSNDRNSQTRFIIIAKKISTDGSIVDPLNLVAGAENQSGSASRSVDKPRKMSIVVSVKNIPGAIFKISSCFALRDIDILKMESRPAVSAMTLDNGSKDIYTTKHWDLIFYFDIEPTTSDATEAALRNLQDYCIWMKVLGSYEAGLRQLTAEPAENWNDMLYSVSLT